MLIPLIGWPHPGIGIVKDSKGNIYYTDLMQVWKISKSKKEIIIPNVHTHELYVDQNDNLFGEGGEYDERSKKFYHYLWVYRSTGNFDTVIGMKEAYVTHDFTLCRDKAGNEYYTRWFLPVRDSNHIFKKTPGGEETILATGNFKNITWLHPQDNGTILYSSDNNIYKIDPSGKILLVKEKIGNAQPSFKFSGNSITIWGIWQDNVNNIYTAVFSDQVVKKIDPAGKVTIVHKSKNNWAPLHGIFDNENRLWILEGSDKNEVRVTMAEIKNEFSAVKKPTMLFYLIVIGIFLFLIFIISKLKKGEGSFVRNPKEADGK